MPLWPKCHITGESSDSATPALRAVRVHETIELRPICQQHGSNPRGGICQRMKLNLRARSKQTVLGLIEEANGTGPAPYQPGEVYCCSETVSDMGRYRGDFRFSASLLYTASSVFFCFAIGISVG